MKNPKKKIQSTAVTIALLIAGAISIKAQSESSREAAGDVARPQTSSPTDFVDTLNTAFGNKPRIVRHTPKESLFWESLRRASPRKA